MESSKIAVFVIAKLKPQQVRIAHSTFIFQWTGISPHGKETKLPPVRLAILEAIRTIILCWLPD